MISTVTKKWVGYLIRRPTMLGYYKPWQRSLLAGASPLGDKSPWMAYGAINWLETYLKTEMQIFEWGSGGSTLFFASRVQSVVSVEHDPLWHATVAEQLLNHKIDNVSSVLCPPERTDPLPEIYTSTDEKYSGLSFLRYAEAIDPYPDDSFDLVVVDGRARPGCMKHALTKVRPGAYLLLDNSDRESYEPGKQLVSTWLSREYYGPGPYHRAFWGTTTWRKPSSLERPHHQVN